MNKPRVTMTKPQITGGLMFLPFYLVIIQVLISVIYVYFTKRIPGTSDGNIIMVINYYVYFAITIIIFRKYLADSLRVFVQNFFTCVRYIIASFLLINLSNLLVSAIFLGLSLSINNENDAAIQEYLEQSRGMVIISAVMLGPLVEESIFRGLIFDNLRRINRVLAYIVSCFAFALLHLWSGVLLDHDYLQLILIIQYLPAGALLAWSFEKSGTIWTPIVLHMLLNAILISAS